MSERSEQVTRGTGHVVRGHAPRRKAGLRGLAEVAVVQAADFGNLHDLPGHGELNRPGVGCVLVQREVGTRLVVVGKASGRGGDRAGADSSGKALTIC